MVLLNIRLQCRTRYIPLCSGHAVVALAPGPWLLATGHWPLATGYWVVTTNVGTALKAAATQYMAQYMIQYMTQYMKGHCLNARFSGLPMNDPDHGRVVVTAGRARSHCH